MEGAGTATVPWSRTAKILYDAFGRPVESFLPAIVSSIDAGMARGAGPKHSTIHDGFDRVVRETTPDGRVTTSQFEPREVVETNPRSISTQRIFDVFGELVQVVRNPGGPADERSTHRFVRDGRGEILRVVDGDGSVRRIERDGGGRIRYMTLPNRAGGKAERFAMCHDVEDRLERFESPAGRVATIVYDELGRTLLSSAIDANGTSIETTQTYDEPVAGGLGRLTSKSDESGSYRMTYDVYGRPQTLEYRPSSRASAGAPNVAPKYSAALRYSPAGHLNQLNLAGLPSSNPSLSYARDEKGRARVVEVRRIMPRGAISPQGEALAADVSYDASDRITFTRYGNGTSGSWVFNPITERLDEIAYKSAANEVLAALGVLYDANDNPIEETRRRFGVDGIHSQKVFTYDALDRLRTSDSSSPAGNRRETYAFSPSGNLLSAGTDQYAYDSPVTSQAATSVRNASSERALRYDTDGYLSSDAETRADGSKTVRSMEFDALGCMHAITRKDVSSSGTSRSAESEYTCGLDGRVVARATTKPDGSKSRRIDFGGIAEIRPDEGVLVLRIPLSGSVSVEDARSLTTGDRIPELSGYLMNDARGSVLAATEFESSSPGIVREADYDPWGKKVERYSLLSEPRHGFAGAEADDAVGTYTFGARTYDPSLRRWVSPDPLLASLPSIDEEIGEALNLYSYADGNPVKKTDKSGFFWPLVAAVIGGAAVIIGMGISAPSDTSKAPADILGMMVAVPGPSIAAGMAGKLAERVVVTSGERAVAKAAAEGVAETATVAEKAAPVEGAAAKAAAGAGKSASSAERAGVTNSAVRAEANSTGRGANNLKPDSAAKGPHSTFKTDAQGVRGHAEWKPNAKNPTGFDQAKRVDVRGKSHYNSATKERVSTPHVHEKGTPGGLRPARPNEVPK